MHHQPAFLFFNIGSDPLLYLQQIKTAMAFAIISQVQNDCASKENSCFQIYQHIFLEADCMEARLQAASVSK